MDGRACMIICVGRVRDQKAAPFKTPHEPREPGFDKTGEELKNGYTNVPPFEVKVCEWGSSPTASPTCTSRFEKTLENTSALITHE